MIHAWNEAQKRATDFYEKNQLVYLKRDTSQFGRIGCGAYGDRYDLETRTQYVFWEHEGGDIVTLESVDDLVGEEELRERRRLFFSVMRRPEMRVLRLALRSLDWNQGIDWQNLPNLTIDQYTDDAWMLVSEGLMLVCVNTQVRDLTYEDFLFFWTHVDREDCPCEDCVYARQREARIV